MGPAQDYPSTSDGLWITPSFEPLEETSEDEQKTEQGKRDPHHCAHHRKTHQHAYRDQHDAQEYGDEPAGHLEDERHEAPKGPKGP